MHYQVADFDGDGIDELVATTTNSVHLFHHDTQQVCAKLEAEWPSDHSHAQTHTHTHTC